MCVLRLFCLTPTAKCSHDLFVVGLLTVSGEYILMQLMRLGIIKADQIKKMKAQFKRLDIHKTGVLDVHSMRASGFLHAPVVRRSSLAQIKIKIQYFAFYPKLTTSL
jgi:hypothetical protein